MPSYYAPQLGSKQSEVLLTGDEAHHIHIVKRYTSGTKLKLNGGNGYIANGVIVRIDKTGVWIDIEDCTYTAPSSPRLAIAFTLLRHHHDELIIEKCTELGVSDFFPMHTEYSVRYTGKNTITRFQKIALSAIKQCDNPWLPFVHETNELDNALLRITQAGFTPILCSEKERLNKLKYVTLAGDTCMRVGPEGGWSIAELEMMQNLRAITLSPLITRAETAAIAGAAQFCGLFR
jgi:16S rRNA (uracil1498-N3)-methyltransferase